MNEIIGFDAKALPANGVPFPTMVLLTVLVRRVEGTHKAYQAIVPDNSRRDHLYLEQRDWVASFGNPLRFEDARRIWDMKPEEYAR